jgi:hypothetical protein
MPFFKWLKPKSENRGVARPPEKSVAAPAKPTPKQPAIEPLPPHLLGVQVGAFFEEIPKEIVGKNDVDRRRTVTIAKEDLVIDEEARTASLPLSILSLSCPEIFSRPVSFEEDRPVTFSLDYKAPQPAILLGETPKELSSSGHKELDNALPRGADEAPSYPAPKVEQQTLLPKQPIAIKSEENFATSEFLPIALKKIALTLPPNLKTPAIQALTNSDAVLRFPVSLVKAQLASGRILIPFEKFLELVPTELKNRFDTVDRTAEIPIPLEEVIPQLPSDAIQRRGDQEPVEEPESIVTPFSEHAREDAARFGVGEKPEQSPVLPPPAGKTPAPQAKEVHSAAPVAEESAKVVNVERLQSIFMTDESLDLAGVVAHIAKLPGLTSSLLTYRDGRKIAGGLGGLERESALALLLPELFNQVDSQISPLDLGQLETLTFHCGRQQLSAFLLKRYSLIVLHENRSFKPGVREKIWTILNEIA